LVAGRRASAKISEFHARGRVVSGPEVGRLGDEGGIRRGMDGTH
jgi:hypothetical protein